MIVIGLIETYFISLFISYLTYFFFFFFFFFLSTELLQQLESHIFEEWKDYYINYKKLKKLLEVLDSSVSDFQNVVDDLQVGNTEAFSIFGRMTSYIKSFSPMKKIRHRKRSESQSNNYHSDFSKFKDTHTAFKPVSIDSIEQKIPKNSINQSKRSLVEFKDPIILEEEERKEQNNKQSDEPILMDILDRKYVELLSQSSSFTLNQKKFIDLLLSEVEKVDSWFCIVEEQLINQFKALKIQSDSDIAGKDELHILKRSYVKLFRKISMLLNFRYLNVIGFDKILKKFDKTANSNIKDEFLLNYVEPRHVCRSTVILELRKLIIAVYAKKYENGDQNHTKIRLLSKMTDSDISKREMLVMGFKVGLVVCLIFWTFSALYYTGKHRESYLEDTGKGRWTPLYRCIGLFIIFLWMWGIVVFIFERYRINYVYIFEFDPRTRLTQFQIWNEASTLSIVYLINLLMFLYGTGIMFDIPLDIIYVLPISLFIFFTLKLFVPFRPFSHWRTRRTLLDIIKNIIISPFGRVRFRDFFLADIITSMAKLLQDLFMAIVVLFSSITYSRHKFTDGSSVCSESAKKVIIPIVICLPYWFRFAQCMNRYMDTKKRFPHIANAFKYALAHSVTIIGAFHPAFTRSGGSSDGWDAYRVFWLLSCSTSSLYAFWWDVTQDWGHFPSEPKKKYPNVSEKSTKKLVTQSRIVHQNILSPNFDASPSSRQMMIRAEKSSFTSPIVEENMVSPESIKKYEENLYLGAAVNNKPTSPEKDIIFENKNLIVSQNNSLNSTPEEYEEQDQQYNTRNIKNKTKKSKKKGLFFKRKVQENSSSSDESDHAVHKIVRTLNEDHENQDESYKQKISLVRQNSISIKRKDDRLKRIEKRKKSKIISSNTTSSLLKKQLEDFEDSSNEIEDFDDENASDVEQETTRFEELETSKSVRKNTAVVSLDRLKIRQQLRQDTGIITVYKIWDEIKSESNSRQKINQKRRGKSSGYPVNFSSFYSFCCGWLSGNTIHNGDLYQPLRDQTNQHDSDSSHSPPFLRKKLIFKDQIWFYYYAIVADLFLRLTWTFTLIPVPVNPYFSSSQIEEYFLPIIAFLELYRRVQWAVIRVEKEHVSNSDSFRKYNFVPMYFDSREKQDVRNRQFKTIPLETIVEVVIMICIVVIVGLVAAFT